MLMIYKKEVSLKVEKKKKPKLKAVVLRNVFLSSFLGWHNIFVLEFQVQFQVFRLNVVDCLLMITLKSIFSRKKQGYDSCFSL